MAVNGEFQLREFSIPCRTNSNYFESERALYECPPPPPARPNETQQRLAVRHHWFDLILAAARPQRVKIRFFNSFGGLNPFSVGSFARCETSSPLLARRKAFLPLRRGEAWFLVLAQPPSDRGWRPVGVPRHYFFAIFFRIIYLFILSTKVLLLFFRHVRTSLLAGVSYTAIFSCVCARARALGFLRKLPVKNKTFKKYL